MKRDEEIQRLVKYAEALGVTVIFSDKAGIKYSAEWSLDGKTITVYKKKQKSKTETILTLVHELGHSLDHIYRLNRQPDLQYEYASTENSRGKISKKKRKMILESEIAATKYWEMIYKETNLQIPLWKLHAQKEMDIWQYEVYHEMGHYPDRAQIRKKSKELSQKHKGINYE